MIGKTSGYVKHWEQNFLWSFFKLLDDKKYNNNYWTCYNLLDRILDAKLDYKIGLEIKRFNQLSKGDYNGKEKEKNKKEKS